MSMNAEPRQQQVLMICYYYPPILAAGSTRSAAFAASLADCGWDPIILSVRAPKDPWVDYVGEISKEKNVIRSYEFNLSAIVDFLHGCFRRLFRLFGKELQRNYFREFLCIPDPQISWFPFFTGRKAAKNVDVIYASCSPFSSALLACLLKKTTGKPVVIDFRDAWSLNPHGGDHTAFHHWCIKRLEAWVVSRCDTLILNTLGAERLYREKYPEAANKFTTISNGYDEIRLVDGNPTEKNTFTIMHVGSFYGSRGPRMLLECLAELNLPDMEFVQVGATCSEIDEFQGRIKIRALGIMPRQQALDVMKEASLLYLKQGWEPGVKDYVAIAAKTYEYIATGLPILADVPPGDNAGIVREYAANSYVVDSGLKEDLKAALVAAYEARTRVSPAIKEEFIRRFHRKELAQRLAEALEATAGNGNQR